MQHLRRGGRRGRGRGADRDRDDSRRRCATMRRVSRGSTRSSMTHGRRYRRARVPHRREPCGRRRVPADRSRRRDLCRVRRGHPQRRGIAGIGTRSPTARTAVRDSRSSRTSRTTGGSRRCAFHDVRRVPARVRGSAATVGFTRSRIACPDVRAAPLACRRRRRGARRRPDRADGRRDRPRARSSR